VTGLSTAIPSISLFQLSRAGAVLDRLMRDIGLKADDINGLTDSVKPPEGEQPH